MAVSCTSAAFAAAGYPSKFHGKLISGNQVRYISSETHKNGVPRQASEMLRSESRWITQVTNPFAAPHTEAISSKIPHPPAVERPPCTASTFAIHGTDVRTKQRPCRNPQQ